LEIGELVARANYQLKGKFNTEVTAKKVNYQVAIVRRILFLLLFIIGLSGCTDKSSEKVIRFGLYNVPVTLDPRYATDAISSRLNRLLYQRLVDFDQQYLPKPSLANWEQLSLNHYRFTLKEKSYFHHGKRLTMSDVKATYENILKSEKISPHRNSIKHIKKIVQIDENTIDFILSRNDPLFPSFLIIGILPKDLLDKKHHFNTQPVGSGKFTFVDWPYDNLLKLKRLKDDQLFEFIGIKDPTVRVLKLLHGEIDLLQNNLAAEQVDYLKNQQELKFQEVGGSNYSYIGFNLKDQVTSQLPLRQAIAHAIDRDSIIRFVLGKAAVKATGFFPVQHWAANKAITPLDYDPEKAKKILNNMGYSVDNPLKLVFKTSSNPFSIRKATIIQEQLRQVGIEMEIRSYDWGTFYGDIKKGNFQMYSLEWVGIKSPDIFKYVFHSQSVPPKGANRGRLIDKQLDNLIESADSAENREAMKSGYAKVQDMIHNILPYVSLWYMANISFYRDNIRGYKLYGDGIYDGLNYVEKN